MGFKRISSLDFEYRYSFDKDTLDKLILSLEKIDKFPSKNVLTNNQEDLSNLVRKVKICSFLDKGRYFTIQDIDKRDVNFHHTYYFAKSLDCDENLLKNLYPLII